MTDFQIHLLSCFRCMQAGLHKWQDSPILYIYRNTVQARCNSNLLAIAHIFTRIEIVPVSFRQYHRTFFLAFEHGGYQQIFTSHILVLNFFGNRFQIRIIFQICIRQFRYNSLFRVETRFQIHGTERRNTIKMIACKFTIPVRHHLHTQHSILFYLILYFGESPGFRTACPGINHCHRREYYRLETTQPVFR